MNFEQEIIQRLVRIEESQKNILERIDSIVKDFAMTEAKVAANEKRISSLEFRLEDHLMDTEKDKAFRKWKYTLIIPIIVSATVSLTDVIMRLAGY